MAELRPCPFCGSGDDVVIKVSASTLNAYVSCVRCGVIMKQNFKGCSRIEMLLSEMITAAWNRRAGEEA